jgi:hypothetical protein
VNDDLQKILLRGRKIYRRKRTSQGEMFKDQNPPSLQETHRGVWCTACKKRHPYNNAGRVLSHYEKRGECWVLSWLCPVTGNFIGDIWLGSGRREG